MYFHVVLHPKAYIIYLHIGKYHYKKSTVLLLTTVFGCSLLTWHTSFGNLKADLFENSINSTSHVTHQEFEFLQRVDVFFTSLWLVTFFSLLIAFAARTSKDTFICQQKRDRI